jgi:anti-sigma B factor antagonist
MEIQISNNGQTVEAALTGRLDTAAAAAVAKDFSALTEQADKTIVVDCAGLEFISSSGLRLFLTLRKATMTKGGRMVIRHLTEQVSNVFTMTGFLNLFEFEK